VSPALPASSLKELIAYARARPGQLNYSSAGNATSGHLAAVLFNRLAGINTVHVAYKGAAPGMTAVVSGEVQFQFSSTVTAKGQVDSGKLKALAVAGERRSAVLPGVPTFEEAGLPFTAQTWTGIVVPAGTSPAIVQRLAAAIHETMARKEVQDQFARTDTRAVVSTPAEFAALIGRERRHWAEVIEKYNIRL
jgi:tripartite-type tricarboxylate transporter receptor subunit TctC